MQLDKLILKLIRKLRQKTDKNFLKLRQKTDKNFLKNKNSK
jgi:hypothetical protein